MIVLFDIFGMSGQQEGQTKHTAHKRRADLHQGQAGGQTQGLAGRQGQGQAGGQTERQAGGLKAGKQA